uniref:Domain of unknown function at the cortex 1 domain-containing protein n=1 Tax=Craspedostauros australis TaxID=1486917 RepID=A0A7R9WRF7_9STRA|mmetsp:Transcript_1726/g.4758  ORF Transcript_1726/g.4758 Transcript_1726/m.4758 type:complete len:295 (+) Transcript_1726:217-1101(+)|eukprot:CAMPEP_0198111906 /NCGR_PEP_ID=MMETSP1442-20131203/3829_1 /TAXON_ID= /ORGANISM="Craspedostauros australis, Strain CCMP3328" /LENGTH=294 /DNA_ID=CAMNT_0043768513 /DNA_START=170 /DNA_END=1054 /DNA_ORIENTATION=-
MVDTDFMKDRIPPASKWRNETVCMMADIDRGFSVTDENFRTDEPAPIGTPIAIESDVFVGKVLIRIRDAKSDNQEQCSKYFDGKKRIAQTVLQGKFKRADIKFNDVFIGDEYSKRFKNLPPDWMLRPVIAFFGRLVPGIEMDLASDTPSVFTNFCGGAQTMRVDEDGEEPPIDALELDEDVKLAITKSKHHTIANRRKYLSVPRHGAKYTFDPNLVYTFNAYDNIMDYGAYKMKMGMLGDTAMTIAYDGQPAAIGVRLKTNKQWIFRFQIFHESLLKHWEEEKKKEKEAALNSK